ncbi:MULTISPECIES: hypothetical protein [Paenibacillus]|uniref:YgiT-type zinc finger domain-containing protein n=1 Tax=Paenibacillus odorifer TaxID=189426 RepID=A0ABX3HER4_9BACL|nr:hypothetical protein [Paenibacillus odorifer]OMD48527.1 hypothetical protein BSK51_21590 [Paenibacillus odorifer]
MRLRHICEVCGKEEVLTPDQGYEQGWDYPPKMGQFKIVSPRTCGSCGIDGTLWWAISVEGKEPADLNEKQLQTLNRILQEPESISVTFDIEQLS